MSKFEKRRILILCISMIVFILSACAPATTQTQPENPNVAVPQEVERITLEESKVAFDTNSAVFVDVRSEAAYEASHIPGALSFPLQFLKPRINELDPNQWIITYCT